MSNDIPEPVIENYTEDFSDIEEDIYELYDRFIEPIERIRSQAIRPDIELSQLGNVKEEPGFSVREIIKRVAEGIKPSDVLGFKVENRAHAFYRLIGLPVISKDKTKFYTPGFQPIVNREYIGNQLDVISNLSQDAMDMSKERQQSYEDRLYISSNQNIDSVVYCVFLPYFSNKIQVLDKAKKDIFDKDNQSYEIDKELVDAILSDISEKPENKTISINKHILKPFVVDPLIENTVTPPTNIVSAPFLDKYIKNYVSISGSQTASYVPPRLETIIRYRLSDVNQVQLEENQQFLNNFSGVDTENENYQSTKDAIINVLNNTSLKNLTSASIINPNSRELIIIIKIYKLMKYLADLLYENFSRLVTISSEITWEPLLQDAKKWPSTNEKDDSGVYNSANVTSSPNTPLETALFNIKIKQIEKDIFAKYGPQDEQQSEFREKKESLDNSYEKLEGLKNELIQEAGDRLRVIEIITGKHSGVGLIDILAIYSALYAIDKKDLINLLDDNCFYRLAYFYPEYNSKEVAERKNSGAPTKGIGDVMASLEDKINIALDFAEKCYLYNSLNPVEGTPVG